MFIRMTLPAHLDGVDLPAASLKSQRVALVPGRAFHADGSGAYTLRFNRGGDECCHPAPGRFPARVQGYSISKNQDFLFFIRSNMKSMKSMKVRTRTVSR